MRLRIALLPATCLVTSYAVSGESHAPAGPRMQQARPIGITHVTVIDVERGTRLRDHTIVIEAGRISTVGPSAHVRVPDGYGEIEARGKFVIPGLIDSHVHLFWDRDSATAPDSTIRWLRLYVPFGVTTVREASARDLDRAQMPWRSRLDSDGFPIPRINVSGRVDRRHITLAGAGDGRDLTRQLIERGVDGIKIRDGLSTDEIRDVVEEAGRRRIPVFGHTYFRDTDYTREAVLAGVNGVMHVAGIRPLGTNTLPGPPPADTSDWESQWLYRNTRWIHEDTATSNALIRLMKQRGVWLEPTLTTEELILLDPDRLRRHVGARFARHRVEWWREGIPLPRGPALDTARMAFDGMKRFVRRFHEAGGVVIAGTDGRPFPGVGIHDELRLLVEAGLSPAAALRAATFDAARAMRWQNRVGSVAPGRLADLLILDADPLLDIGNAARINAIVLNGRVIEQPEREKILRQLAGR